MGSAFRRFSSIKPIFSLQEVAKRAAELAGLQKGLETKCADVSKQAAAELKSLHAQLETERKAKSSVAIPLSLGLTPCLAMKTKKREKTTPPKCVLFTGKRLAKDGYFFVHVEPPHIHQR
jgi:hypothetical protein